MQSSKIMRIRIMQSIIIGLVALCAACISAPSPTATSLPLSTETLTLVPTSTQPPPTPLETATPSATPSLAASPDKTLVTLDPLIETNLIAPIRITLPENWTADNAAIPMSEGGNVPGIGGMLPFSWYTGTVTGGKGYIVLLWGFRNITTANPGQEAGAQLYLRGDAIRLLNLAVMDPDCNIGIDVDREFAVGTIRAIGAYWASVDCPALADGTPGLPDARGWFAITRQSEINFAFYVYTEPPDALNGAAQTELQAIMDSIEFDFSLLPTPFPTDTATAAP